MTKPPLDGLGYARRSPLRSRETGYMTRKRGQETDRPLLFGDSSEKFQTGRKQQEMAILLRAY